ncbi:MAG TPA: ABC transporter substrate-binding protein [Planctomycetota bacterium]|nr:ABC transporter substrate-binding protein [Planctomycetota bacterium]
MRALPVLAVLIGALGLALGLRVMLRAPVHAGLTPAPAHAVSESSSVPQGHVYTGLAEEPSDINPFTTGEAVARRLVLAYTHDCLLDCDPVTGALRPALATFEVARDGKTCTFALRQGVRFSDGAPLTMADVLFGWDLAKAGHLAFGVIGDAFARVEAVDVLDDQHFRVHFRGVHFAATQAVGEGWFVVQRRFFVDRIAKRAAAMNEPVPPVDSAAFARLFEQIETECGPGTGPYMLQNLPEGPSTWRRRQDLLLVRNPHSWRREAQPGCWNFEGIRTLFRDPQNAFTALVRREVDWFSCPQADEVLKSRPELAQSYRKLCFDYRTLGVFRVVWNCNRPPYDDCRVRRALARLFDQDSMLAVFGSDAAVAARAHAKPDSAEYPHPGQEFGFDPAAARQQLRAAGFDPAQQKPLRLAFLAPDGNETMRRLVDLFADAGKRAGLDLEVRTREWEQYASERDNGAWDGLLALDYFNAWGDPYDFVHSTGLSNFGHWQNDEADRLATAARAELDVGRRQALLRELHELVYQEQPVTFLVHPRASILLNVHVENVAPGPLGLVVERAFVRPEFQRE